MSKVRITVPYRQVCIGDLNRRVKVQRRDIRPPLSGATDFTELFTTVATVWAAIKTPQGKTFWDGASNSETNITHEVLMRSRNDVDVETWLELPSGSRVRVLRVMDFEERGDFLLLPCNERGADSVAAART